jgi:lipoyl(octanoyl) transferase
MGPEASIDTLLVRHLGRQDYEPVWRAMSRFTDQRGEDTQDEVWVVEHPPVFTQGQAGKAEHLLMPGDIPVVQVDRGGQVTYHGPGQLVVYPMLDLRRAKLGVRDLVTATENAIVDCLAEIGLQAYPKADAPGVYVDTPNYQGAKIASLGFRIRRGCSFHGLSLNIAMDMSPYARINPCGYQGLQMAQTSELSDDNRAASMDDLAEILIQKLAAQLGCERLTETEHPTSILPS